MTNGLTTLVIRIIFYLGIFCSARTGGLLVTHWVRRVNAALVIDDGKFKPLVISLHNFLLMTSTSPPFDTTRRNSSYRSRVCFAMIGIRFTGVPASSQQQTSKQSFVHSHMLNDLHWLDLFAWCVRLSSLLVVYRTHLKSMHFHSKVSNNLFQTLLESYEVWMFFFLAAPWNVRKNWMICAAMNEWMMTDAQ